MLCDNFRDINNQMSGRRVSRRGQQSANSLPTSRERSELERLRQSEVALKARIRMASYNNYNTHIGLFISRVWRSEVVVL